MPGGILLGLGAILAHSGWIVPAAPTVSFLYYSSLLGGVLLGWRFHASRIFFAQLVVLLAWAIFFVANSQRVTPVSKEYVLIALAVVVPINFLLIAFSEERGFTTSTATPLGLILFAECVVLAVLSGSTTSAPGHPHHAVPLSLPYYVEAGCAIAVAVLLVRSLLTKKPADRALLWSLIALLLSLNFAGSPRLFAIYALMSSIILGVSVVETSYLLAYHDELTGSPSRRAFNEALRGLQEPYSIAVVDVDHFKKFNDTFGHDVGDEVLRLVAAKLAAVTGGGQAYRCGGEEFAVIFRGKDAAAVMGDLELLRSTIEHSQFRVRGKERRQIPRGPERRTKYKGRPKRRSSASGTAEPVLKTQQSITVSIGVASSTEADKNPEMVVQAADKALYRAKANGRNRVEITSQSRARARTKAGVA